MRYSELRHKAFVEGFSHNDDGEAVGVHSWPAVCAFLLLNTPLIVDHHEVGIHD
jgi:hypothetical protein